MNGIFNSRYSKASYKKALDKNNFSSHILNIIKSVSAKTDSHKEGTN